MAHYIPLTIPLGVKKLWDKWNIRGAILFSLFLQVVLILVGPIRKSVRRQLVVLLIWFAYLLADAAANFAVGLISNSQRNTDKAKPEESTDLLAFWAPFLLLHLGGPDTITAFALEDNQLWLRHLLGLVFQAGAVLYVFVQSLPNKILWIPTLLMFTAGVIKYVERTRALYLASLDRFRDSMLKDPDPGPNYAKLMEEYAFKRGAKLPTRINMTPEPDKEIKASDVRVKEDKLNHLEVVHYAYHYFKTFKGLVVDLIFSFRERDESRDFFRMRTPEDALSILEVELNFLYGTLYTKVEVVHSIIGYIFRFLAFGSVLATLGLFYFRAKKKEVFQGVDIGITYTLLLGAIALDVIAFFMLIFSDRTIATVKNPERPSGWDHPMSSIFSSFLALKRPRWDHCQCKTTHSGCYVKRQVVVTPLLFRRWSGSISQHNLIRYCLVSKSKTIHQFTSLLEIKFNKILHKIRSCLIKDAVSQTGKSSVFETLKPFISKVINLPRSAEESVIQYFKFAYRPWYMPFKDFVDGILYVSSEPFTMELWEFIFEELKKKSEFADTPETAKRISSARGDWVLTDPTTYSHEDRGSQQDHSSQQGSQQDRSSQEYPGSKLLKYVSDVPYDESLLLWHIATDLCYYNYAKEDDLDSLTEVERKHREFSKILSDYMLYLLVFQPTMMSAVAGIGKIRYRDTCAEAEIFFKRRDLGPNQDKKACEKILEVNTEVEPVTVKGDRSKSVLFDASMLAKELNTNVRISDVKWRLMSRVWVELVSYAASHCRASTHAQQVSKGGELITFFWLLMAHFGLGEQFQINEGHARAKLLVGK